MREQHSVGQITHAHPYACKTPEIEMKINGARHFECVPLSCIYKLSNIACANPITPFNNLGDETYARAARAKKLNGWCLFSSCFAFFVSLSPLMSLTSRERERKRVGTPYSSARCRIRIPNCRERCGLTINRARVFIGPGRRGRIRKYLARAFFSYNSEWNLLGPLL